MSVVLRLQSARRGAGRGASNLEQFVTVDFVCTNDHPSHLCPDLARYAAITHSPRTETHS